MSQVVMFVNPVMRLLRFLVYMGLTAPITSYFRALSVVTYYLNISWDLACLRWMLVIWDAVFAGGMTAVAPVFTGAAKANAKRVL